MFIYRLEQIPGPSYSPCATTPKPKKYTTPSSRINHNPRDSERHLRWRFHPLDPKTTHIDTQIGIERPIRIRRSRAQIGALERNRAVNGRVIVQLAGLQDGVVAVVPADFQHAVLLVGEALAGEEGDGVFGLLADGDGVLDLDLRGGFGAGAGTRGDV